MLSWTCGFNQELIATKNLPTKQYLFFHLGKKKNIQKTFRLFIFSQYAFALKSGCAV